MFDYKTAAAYIRVSTDDQVELSPASQLVEIRKWAAANGYFVPDEYVFVDEAKSGRKVTGRDDFRRLIATAKTKPKPFDAILLWKFSRFARNRDDAVYYKSILRKQLKIDVISIKEPIEDGKMGVIMESMIEAMDEYYSINLAEDVKRGMEEKHRRGAAIHPRFRLYRRKQCPCSRPGRGRLCAGNVPPLQCRAGYLPHRPLAQRYVRQNSPRPPF